MLLRRGPVPSNSSAHLSSQLPLLELPEGGRSASRCVDHREFGKLPFRGRHPEELPHGHRSVENVLRSVWYLAHVRKRFASWGDRHHHRKPRSSRRLSADEGCVS